MGVWGECGQEGVAQVDDKVSKTSQNNVGRHHLEQKVMVYLERDPDRPVQFELTRNQHLPQTAKRPFTVTVMFKDPARGLHVAAWRVLLHVVQGRELVPLHVKWYCQQSLANHGAWDGDMLPEGLEGVGASESLGADLGASESQLGSGPGRASPKEEEEDEEKEESPNWTGDTAEPGNFDAGQAP